MKPSRRIKRNFRASPDLGDRVSVLPLQAVWTWSSHLTSLSLSYKISRLFPVLWKVLTVSGNCTETRGRKVVKLKRKKMCICFCYRFMGGLEIEVTFSRCKIINEKSFFCFNLVLYPDLDLRFLIITISRDTVASPYLPPAHPPSRSISPMPFVQS